MSDDEVKAEIKRIAAENNIEVSDGQVEQLLSLCRSLEKLDPDQLKAKVEEMQDTVKKAGRRSGKIEGNYRFDADLL